MDQNSLFVFKSSGDNHREMFFEKETDLSINHGDLKKEKKVIWKYTARYLSTRY